MKKKQTKPNEQLTNYRRVCLGGAFILMLIFNLIAGIYLISNLHLFPESHIESLEIEKPLFIYISDFLRALVNYGLIFSTFYFVAAFHNPRGIFNTYIDVFIGLAIISLILKKGINNQKDWTITLIICIFLFTSSPKRIFIP